MEIAALLSGGVDSSVAVHLLKEQGLTPTLFYIRIGMDTDGFTDCSAEDDIELSTLIAKRYGCRFEIVDLHREYWDNVVSYVIETVKLGFTPNPDVMCNKLIKFGSFEQKYGKDFDKTATGHYATTTEKAGRIYLSTAKDSLKDQTDFLAQINYLQVAKLMFPIGGYMKHEVREIAQKAALPSANRKDSQGICFLGKVNYNDFIGKYLGIRKGPIVEIETGKILGQHNGYWFHTIGQRKGLGLSGGPWYVIKKETTQNIIYVSGGYDPEKQYGKTIFLHNLNFISGNPFQPDVQGEEIRLKIRHTPEFITARIFSEEKRFRIEADEKIQGIAAGQFGVIYDKQARLCFGSGEIVDPNRQPDTIEIG